MNEQAQQLQQLINKAQLRENHNQWQVAFINGKEVGVMKWYKRWFCAVDGRPTTPRTTARMVCE